jgi:RimJ/RimL family protein N-acetyltransferase
MPTWYGKGYGFEAASAVLRYALEELHLPKVLGITLPSNEGSARILEKIGLNYMGLTRLSAEDDELMLFSS